MKNTLKPLPSFPSDTQRTDEAEEESFGLHNNSLAHPNTWKFARELERELSELRKDKERLDWLIDNNCEIYEPDTALLYCDCDRESIDEMMSQATRWSHTLTFTEYINIMKEPSEDRKDLTLIKVLHQIKEDFIYIKNENLRLQEENNQLKQAIGAINKETINPLWVVKKPMK